LAKFADGDDRTLGVVGARNHVETSAAGLDVRTQELCDFLRRAIRGVPLEGLEGHLVEVLHLCGERDAGSLARRRKAAPDVECMLEGVAVSAGLARLTGDLVADGAEAARGHPDPEPPVAELRSA